MATTPVFLPGKFHGQRSLAGYSPWGSQKVGHDWAYTHIVALVVKGVASGIRLCCMLSRVWLFATPWTVAHQAPLSMGILQARILEWVAMLSTRGSSQLRDQTQVSCIAGKFSTTWTTTKPKNTGVGSLTLLPQIFLTQESNWGLLHRRQIFYQLSYQGKPLESDCQDLNLRSLVYWLYDTEETD